MELHIKWSVRHALIGLAVLVVASTVWRYRDHALVQAVLHPKGAARSQIQFDNGSARDAAGKDGAAAAGIDAENEPGKLKKCIRGKDVLYTDQACAAGAKVVAIDGGNVTVIPSRPSKAPERAEPQASRHTLRDALDVSDHGELQDKRVQRAIRP